MSQRNPLVIGFFIAATFVAVLQSSSSNAVETETSIRETFRAAEIDVSDDVIRVYQNYLERDPGMGRAKVFALSEDGVTMAWAVRRELQEATKDSMRKCERETRGRPCRVFSLGENVVWDLSGKQLIEAREAYQGRILLPRELEPLSASALSAYEEYLDLKDDWGFRAFALAKNEAWAYRSRSDMRAVIDDALISCKVHAKGAPCRLFALGGVVVWEMSEKELERTKNAYRSK